MNAVLLAYYVGLVVFIINGFQLLHMRAQSRKLEAQEERLRRILMRAKLRRK